MSLFETGIRPAIDAHLAAKAAEKRDYGEYWSASSAGYCMRKVIFDRLQLPAVKEDARKQRVFEAGHIFHEWAQRVTRDAGLSIAQELELQDEGLMVRGHIDDLVLIEGETFLEHDEDDQGASTELPGFKKLILYDYKTQNSRAFTYQKDRPMSHYHKMQLGTYMYMLRQLRIPLVAPEVYGRIQEARILKISKDDLRMSEQQLLWSPELENEVTNYWRQLEGFWRRYKESGDPAELPLCTCHEQENGFMAKEAYNPYFYNGQPCSTDWLLINREEAVMAP